MHYTKYTDKDQEIGRLENEVYDLKRRIKELEKPVAGSDYSRIPCYDTPTVVEQEQAEEIEDLTQKIKLLESLPVLKPGQVAVNEEDLRLVTENYFITDFLNIEIPCRGALSHVGDAFERIVESYQNQHPTPAPDAETEDKAGGKTDD